MEERIMDLRETIFNSICEFGQNIAVSCKEASGLYQQSHFVISVPRMGVRSFNSHTEAVRFLHHNDREIRECVYRDLEERIYKDEGRKYYRDIKGEEFEKRMHNILQHYDFSWNSYDLNKKDSQELMNLFVALKQVKEKLKA